MYYILQARYFGAPSYVFPTIITQIISTVMQHLITYSADNVSFIFVV